MNKASAMQFLDRLIRERFPPGPDCDRWLAWLTEFASTLWIPQLRQVTPLGQSANCDQLTQRAGELRARAAAARANPMAESRAFAGETLVELERAFGTRPSRVGKCEGAREFIVRVVPELAYVFSVPGQVVRVSRASHNDVTDVPVGLQMLGSCVKEGFDRVEKLAVRYFRKGLGSRRAVHGKFAALEEFLEPPKSHEDFAAVMRRVEAAVAIVDLF